MKPMKPLSFALQKSLQSMARGNELAAKAARATQIKRMWSEVVEPVFLEHTNRVFVQRKGERKILVVYVDESIFAAELNARRELIELKLFQKFGVKFDELQVRISGGKYKNEYLFRDREETPFYAQPVRRVPLSEEKKAELKEMCSVVSDERLRESLYRAMISSMEMKSDIKNDDE